MHFKGKTWYYEGREIMLKKWNNDRETTLCSCSVVLVAISCHLSEVNPISIIAYLMSNQLKACSCASSRTSESSLVFPTLTLVRVTLLQGLKTVPGSFQIPAFRIFIHKLWAPSFTMFIGKVHIFMSHNAAGFIWLRLFEGYITLSTG